jgi:predicted nucleotidyltransferase
MRLHCHMKRARAEHSALSYAKKLPQLRESAFRSISVVAVALVHLLSGSTEQVSLCVFMHTHLATEVGFLWEADPVKRERAVELAEHLLRNLDAGQHEWPLSLLTEVYVFGSFARGALAPHDLDIDVEYKGDERWTEHFMTSFTHGRDLHSPMRSMLTTGKRGYQFQFEFRKRSGFEMTLLWQKGDSLATALERLHAIQADEAAGRAPRDWMLPELEGLDDWISRPNREVLCAAVSDKAIKLERVLLLDSPVTNQAAAKHLAYRWKPSSPLYRAALAVVSHWEREGIDPGHCHLHGVDVRDRETPYFAGFGLRYFKSIPACLTEYGGEEWIEVVHPTRTRPLDCLRIVPVDKEKLKRAIWG